MHSSCLYLSYIFCVILICITMSECALTPEEIRGLHLNRKYCGSRLSEAMKQVCDPTVRDFFLNKIGEFNLIFFGIKNNPLIDDWFRIF